jgi:hypothetical protein
MLEAQALDGVRQLDVHAQVVAVELERVARPQGAVLLHVHDQACHRRVDLEPPVHVARGMRLEPDGRSGGGVDVLHVSNLAGGGRACQAL